MRAAKTNDCNTADRSWSLTLALCSVAQRAGHEIDLDDLHSALGLPLLVCAVPAEPRMSLWATYARDAFLEPAAHAYGITTRAVHPPEAARGLDHAEGFRQHFDASYRPFIERALENGQPVLAWQGWAGDREGLWGVITHKCDDGIGFGGEVSESASPRARADHATLVKPPVQLHVVEIVTATTPSPQECLALAVDHALSIINNEPGERLGVITGPGAFSGWIARLKQLDTAAGTTDAANLAESADNHQRLAVSVVAGHKAMLRFLQGHAADTRSDRQALIETLVSMCNRVVTVLTESTDPAVVERLMQTSPGRAELVDNLEVAWEACSRVCTY